MPNLLPLKGTSAQISGRAINDGQLLINTESGAMYVDHNTSRVQIKDPSKSPVDHTHDYSKVTLSRSLTSGTKIGTISIDGTSTDLYCQTNTDTKVTQTVTTSDASYPLLLAPAGQTATATTTSYFDSDVTLNPSTNTIAANISGNSSTSDKVYSTLTEPDSTDSNKVFYIPFFAGSSSGNKSIKDNGGLRYQTYQGTTEVDGLSELLLGTSTASGNNGNKTGKLRLYSKNIGFGIITQADTTGNISHVLPATGGTLLNTGTTSFTQSLTKGTKIGSIKINGTSTDLYAPTNTDTKVTQTAVSSSTSGNYPLLLAPAGQTTTTTTTAKFYSGLTYDPSTYTLDSPAPFNIKSASTNIDAASIVLHATQSQVQLTGSEGIVLTGETKVDGTLIANNIVTGTKTVTLSSATTFVNSVTLTSTDLGFTPTANTSVLVSVRKSSTSAPLYLNVYAAYYDNKIYLCISNGAASNTAVPAGTYMIDYIVTNNA